MTEKLLKETETADILTLKVATLRNWRLQGRGPTFYKFGRCVRYGEVALKSFIENSQVKTGNHPGTNPKHISGKL